jgi:hypothetical protein
MQIAVEHPGGEGVANELFEMGLESFIVGPQFYRPQHRWLIILRF